MKTFGLLGCCLRLALEVSEQEWGLCTGRACHCCWGGGYIRGLWLITCYRGVVKLYSGEKIHYLIHPGLSVCSSPSLCSVFLLFLTPTPPSLWLLQYCTVVMCRVCQFGIVAADILVLTHCPHILVLTVPICMWHATQAAQCFKLDSWGHCGLC